ncbi:MAG: HAMP domain-containing protein [Gammaproteobacteria bacterium]|nr:HAMP domain-containing protein [Gammaproteobacteria bacterium]
MRLLPKTLFGRMVLVLSAGLLITLVITVGILLHDRGQSIHRMMSEDTVARAAAITNVLNKTPTSERPRIVSVLNSNLFRVRLQPGPGLPAGIGEGNRLTATMVRTTLLQDIQGQPEIRIAIRHALRQDRTETRRPPPQPRFRTRFRPQQLKIEIALNDGSWVSFGRRLPPGVTAWPFKLLAILATLIVGILLISLLVVRWITGSLTTLSQAADELGRDIHRQPLAVKGPKEVAEAATAFNRMQSRLSRYINDRNQILTAVSHDLKTPITRLRLRSEMLDDEVLQQKIQRDLDDMEKMVSATLDFMRGSTSQEKSQPIDIQALLESQLEDAEDAGAKTQLTGSAHQPYTGKPLALKRCLANLIDNAIRYGDCAEVTIDDQSDRLTITIADRGPGIAEEKLEAVFEPFSRLEESRNRESGGTGLGLGIARNIARSHGGELTLGNRPEGGLTARLTLPR